MKQRLQKLERKTGQSRVVVVLFTHRAPGEPAGHYEYTPADLEQIKQAELEADRTGKYQIVYLHDYGSK